MIPKDCKRLAEVDFLIAEVSRHAARFAQPWARVDEIRPYVIHVREASGWAKA
jgi:hypothetical protein